jgi:hypothetical protein
VTTIPTEPAIAVSGLRRSYGSQVVLDGALLPLEPRFEPSTFGTNLLPHRAAQAKALAAV